MWITIDYINKFDSYNFDPFLSDMTTAKIRYLNYVWRGYKAVRITTKSWTKPEETIWETPKKVFPKYEPVDGLPF